VVLEVLEEEEVVGEAAALDDVRVPRSGAFLCVVGLWVSSTCVGSSSTAVPSSGSSKMDRPSSPLMV
jgi:hypothetical protein